VKPEAPSSQSDIASYTTTSHAQEDTLDFPEHTAAIDTFAGGFDKRISMTIV